MNRPPTVDDLLAAIDGAQTAIESTGNDRDNVATILAKAAAFQASAANKGLGLDERLENFAKFILDPILLTTDVAEQLAISEQRIVLCRNHCLPMKLSLASSGQTGGFSLLASKISAIWSHGARIPRILVLFSCICHFRVPVAGLLVAQRRKIFRQTRASPRPV